MSLAQRVQRWRLVRTAPNPALAVAALCLAATAGAVGCGGKADSPEQSSDTGAIDSVEPGAPPASGALAAPGTPPAAPSCPWHIDDLLARVQVPSSEGLDCGTVNSGLGADAILPAFQCFTDAAKLGGSAQFTVIDCTDCWIASTFVTTESYEILRIFTEHDLYGDAVRHSRVEDCVGIGYASGDTVKCQQPTELFTCEGPLSDVY